jgi:hypothetical protein
MGVGCRLCKNKTRKYEAICLPEPSGIAPAAESDPGDNAGGKES